MGDPRFRDMAQKLLAMKAKSETGAKTLPPELEDAGSKSQRRPRRSSAQVIQDEYRARGEKPPRVVVVKDDRLRPQENVSTNPFDDIEGRRADDSKNQSEAIFDHTDGGTAWVEDLEAEKKPGKGRY